MASRLPRVAARAPRVTRVVAGLLRPAHVVASVLRLPPAVAASVLRVPPAVAASVLRVLPVVASVLRLLPVVARSLRLLPVVALAGLVPCAPAHADGFLRDGLGPIPAGRGGTNVAHADNGSVLLDNPAALANVARSGLVDLHLGQYLFSFRYADPENAPTSGSGTLLPIPDAAILARSPTDDRLGYGLGLFVPAGFGTDYTLRAQPAFGGGRHGYHSFATFVKLVAGVAWRLTDRLSVGAHAGLAGAYVSLRLPYWVQTGTLAGAPIRASLSGVGLAPAWAVGLQWTIAHGTVAGASYTAPTRFTTGIGGRARIGLGDRRERYAASLDLALPRSVAAGLRHDVVPWARLSSEITWRDWSDAFDGISLHLTEGRGALGIPAARDRVPLAWRDTVTIGLGCELLPARGPTVIRLGYTHHSSPAPDASLTPVIPVTLEHVLAFGLGFRVGETDLDLSYQYTFGPTRRVEQSRLVGGDFASSRLAVDGHAWFVGLTRGWGR